MNLKTYLHLLGILVILMLLAMGIYYLGVLFPPQTSTSVDNESSKADLIRVSSPRSNTIVRSPLKITGQARGYWFFEASFPIYVVDTNNQQLGVGIAQAQSDPASGEVNWMTEDFVPFTAEVIFAEPTTNTGWLILHKDNPSGLPEYDDELRLPVLF